MNGLSDTILNMCLCKLESGQFLQEAYAGLNKS